jgi:hypothetical protein
MKAMNRTTKHWIQRLLYFLGFLVLGPAIGICGALLLAALGNYSGIHHLPSIALPAGILLTLTIPVTSAWSVYLKAHPKPRFLPKHQRRQPNVVGP